MEATENVIHRLWNVVGNIEIVLLNPKTLNLTLKPKLEDDRRYSWTQEVWMLRVALNNDERGLSNRIP